MPDLESFFAVTLIGLLAIAAPAAADPVTDHLDDLILELQARSEALTGSEDKAEQKQKKTVDKLLATFAKDSKGPDQDLKNLGKAAKSLTKVFPEEFTPPASVAAAPAATIASFEDLIVDALTAFNGDIDLLLEAVQGTIDGAPPGKCQDKAQSAVEKVVAVLDASVAETDLSKKAKALAKAIKSVAKSEALAEKALECVPSLDWFIDIATISLDDGPAMNLIDDAFNSSDSEMGSTYFGNDPTNPNDDTLFIFINSPDDLGLSFTLPLGSSPVGPHFVNAQLVDGLTFAFVSGFVTVTKFPKSLEDHVHATFDLAGEGRTVAGSFAIYTLDVGAP